jgi:hypothetical protein
MRDLSGLLKRLLVSLPGKLGARYKAWTDCPNQPADSPYGRWYSVDKSGSIVAWRAIAWRVQREVRERWSSNASPAVASWINSLARMKLLKLLRLLDKEEYFYVDTDAILVSASGLAKLKSLLTANSGSLGSLMEKGRADDCCIYGIKHYRFSGRIICAGMRQDSETIERTDGLYYRREGPVSQANRGERPRAVGGWKSGLRSDIYRHGIPDTSGRVLPIRLSYS